nr:2206_t:CDS:2 [Entrophospora candida]
MYSVNGILDTCVIAVVIFIFRIPSFLSSFLGLQSFVFPGIWM